jgi:hypothetical protein
MPLSRRGGEKMNGRTTVSIGLGTLYADGGEGPWFLACLGNALTSKPTNYHRAVASLLIILITAIVSTATHAAVLCKKRNEVLVLRNQACRANQTAVDPAELGLLRLESKVADHVTEIFFYSYFMDTSLPAQDLIFGQAKLQTTGSPGEFRVCGNNPSDGDFNYVAYANGTRIAGTVGTGACTPPIKVGAGGDFQVAIRRAQIFGVHSGDVPPNYNYNVYGFSQLRTPLELSERSDMPAEPVR